MLFKYWCFLILLYWSIVYVDCAKEPKKKPKCEINSPFSSPYLSAYLSHFTPGTGCSSNNTTTNKQAVHIIDFKVDETKYQVLDGKRNKVHLRIEPYAVDSDGYNFYGRPLIFVLNSNKPVKWKVEFTEIGSAKIKHLFMVSSHSTIRFKKSVIKVRGKKMKNFDNKTDLVNWTRRRFGAVTSFSEAEGTGILFRVGAEKNAGSTCDVNGLKETDFVITSYKNLQTITGCTTQRRHILKKPAYIIELQQAPQSTTDETVVDLEITSVNNEELTKDFYLILKSPSHIKWKIRSRKIQGWIDIVTDAEADLKDIRMQTVASRQEVMKTTGAKLIDWAEKYISPVDSYFSIHVANKIKLMLPDLDSKKEEKTLTPLHERPDVTPPLHNGDINMKENLNQIINTECSGGKLRVFIPSHLMQEWELVKEQITLLDRTCGARQNSTHVILESSLNGCLTSYIQIDDMYEYSNAIVIHAAGVNDHMLEEFGSAFMDPSEMSGGDSTNTYMDDEDFQSRQVQIDVKCEVKPQKSTESDVSDLRLELFKSESYTDPIKTSSSVVKDTRVYIQASITSDIPLKVQVENCWLSQLPSATSSDLMNKKGQVEQVVLNGCATEENLKWHDFNIVRGIGRNMAPFTRFSFPLRDYFNSEDTYLYCELSHCQMHFVKKYDQIPLCPESPREHCKQHLPIPRHLSKTANPHYSANNKILVFGPITVIDTSVSGSSGDTSGYKTGSGGVTSTERDRENQHQQSVTIEGLDSETVVGIAFAAFAIGILLTGTLWFIHTHTGPAKHVLSSHGSTETTGELSPNTQIPVSA